MQRIALVSEHASPLAAAGGVETQLRYMPAALTDAFAQAPPTYDSADTRRPSCRR